MVEGLQLWNGGWVQVWNSEGMQVWNGGWHNRCGMVESSTGVEWLRGFGCGMVD